MSFPCLPHIDQLTQATIKLGLCSYDVNDLTHYLAICEEKGYVKPTIYQGCYNALYRSSEKELVPFLRKHGIAYYVFRWAPSPINT